MKIAITGKGGVGKTTLAGLLARLYAAEGRTVLAVDADPDANLASALGISPEAASKALPLAEQSDLIEERTGSRPGKPGGMFSLNPKVDDIPEAYSIRHEGVRLLVVSPERSAEGPIRMSSPDSPPIPGGCFSMASIDAEACSYSRVDDEEPPSTTVQFLSPRAVARFSRPKRPRATAERDIFSPGAPPGRTPRSTFQTRAFRKTFYPDVPDRDWNDWHWQARNRLRTLAQLEQVLVLSDDERAALSEGGAMLPVSITPYYMSLVSRDDRNQPLRRTVIPTTAEFHRGLGEADDPLGEDGDSPVPGLVHRYPDRVLLLVTDFCSSYCRYCTRSRVVGHGGDRPQRGPAGTGVRLHPPHAGHPRRAHFRRRSAGPERRAARLDSRPVAADSARRVPADRHEDARRAAAADHARNCAGCSASTIRCG